MKNKEFIYEYWGKTELGKMMIESNHVTESDLLFLIPNNVKRMHGLPLTRISGKKKRKQKNKRRSSIAWCKCYDLIDKIINDTLISSWTNNVFFDKFVDFKNLNLGDKNVFVGE